MILPPRYFVGRTNHAKNQIFKNFSNPYVWKKTNTHIYDVHEAKIVKFIATGSEIQTLGRSLFGH